MRQFCGLIASLLFCGFLQAQELTTVGGTTITGSSSFACVSGSFSNQNNLNNSSTTDWVDFSLLAGLGCSYWIQSTLNGTGNAGTYAGFHVRSNNLLNLLPGMEIHTYMDGSFQERVDWNSFLSIITQKDGDIYFRATKPYNTLRLVFKGLLNVAYDMDLFYGFGMTNRPDVEILPLHFTEFHLSRQHEVVHLSWNIHTDEVINSMVVERSSNGVNFTPIKTIGTYQGGAYSYTDTYPSMGFYRIKVVSENQTFYSETKVVENITALEKLTCTNPVQGVLKLQLHCGHEDTYLVEIFSINGRLVHRERQSSFGNNPIFIQRGSIENGPYILKVSDSQGKSLSTKVVYE